MAIYLKKFENHTQYENYINGSGAILPNVSICTTEGDVHYNPFVELETRLVAKFNVTDTSNPTPIVYRQYTSGFSEIEIDGVAQQSVVSAYTFSTTGEHTVKYTLRYPTSISNYALYQCTSITSVIIPNSVTSIGDVAFGSCSGLTSIVIPDSVSSIGNSAFDSCSSLTSCTIGSGVTSIGPDAFNNCSGLTSIVIPDSVTTIGQYAFASCSSLTSCTIGSGVTSIREHAFASCRSLTSIVIPSGVTSIDYAAFGSCSGLTSIVCIATTAATINNATFIDVKRGGTLTVPIGSSGYDAWMGKGKYRLGYYNWRKVEQ